MYLSIFGERQPGSGECSQFRSACRETKQVPAVEPKETWYGRDEASEQAD